MVVDPLQVTVAAATLSSRFGNWQGQGYELWHSIWQARDPLQVEMFDEFEVSLHGEISGHLRRQRHILDQSLFHLLVHLRRNRGEAVASNGNYG